MVDNKNILIRIKVRKKEYDIAIVPIFFDRNTSTPHHYCAYVILKGKKVKEHIDLSHCTYREEDTFGIDTAHSFNEGMTDEEKYNDAIRQIKDLIKVYNRLKDT